MSQTRGFSPTSNSADLAAPPLRVEQAGIDVLELARQFLPWFMLIGLFASLLYLRMTAPGDLHDDDQSKTMAYTVDMIRNKHFAMPQDMYRQPATKPPMYNWLTLPGIYAFQAFHPWLFKLPSILAAIASCGLIIFASKKILAGTPGRPLTLPQPVPSGISVTTLPIGIGIVAAAIFLGNQPVHKMMYLARPDMLLTAFLTGAWVFGTIALLRTEGSTRFEAAIFWICIAGAALTKGPPALAVLAYVLIAAPLFAGGFGSLKRLHWLLAIPLLLLPLALWIVIGYFQSGKTFFDVLFIQEMFSRIKGGGPESAVEAKPLWQMAVWFFQRFGPWALLATVVVVSIPRKRWSQHVLAPVIVWTVLVMVFFSIPGGKRADYLLPIYAPAALAAAYLLVVAGSWMGVTPIRAMVATAIVTAYTVTHLERPRILPSDATEQFVTTIAPMIKKDPLVVVSVAGYQPLLPLLGRFDGTPPIDKEGNYRAMWLKQLANAKWVIMPKSARWLKPAAVSGDLPGGREGRIIQMALYRVGESDGPTKVDIRNMYLRRGPGISSTTTMPADELETATTAPATAPTLVRRPRTPRPAATQPK